MRAAEAAAGRGVWSQLWRRVDFLAAAFTGVLAIAVAHYLLLLKVTTLHTMLERTSTAPLYQASLAFLVPLTFVLFGLNFGIAGFLWRARAGLGRQGGSLLGALVGGFGAACPSCGAYLLSLVGVSAGLSALPFAGLEFWAGASAVMAFTFWWSLRALGQRTCEPSERSCSLPDVSGHYLAAVSMVGLLLVVTLLGLLATHEPLGLSWLG